MKMVPMEIWVVSVKGKMATGWYTLWHKDIVVEREMVGKADKQCFN